MIEGYGDRDTEAFANGAFVRRFQGFDEQARKRLRSLEAATSVGDLRALPSNRFEALRGDRAGEYSIRVNQQWRLCFRWPDGAGGPTEVVLVDYH